MGLWAHLTVGSMLSPSLTKLGPASCLLQWFASWLFGNGSLDFSFLVETGNGFQHSELEPQQVEHLV